MSRLEGDRGVLIFEPDVLDVLREVRIEGNVARIVQQLDRDLYTRVNKVLEALGGKWNRKLRGHVFEEDPSERLMQAVLTGTAVDPKKAFEFFETPPGLAVQLASMADIEPGMRVLEPSAGRGAIADAIRDFCPQCVLEVVEINPRDREVLKTKGHKIVGKDFLKFKRKGYDRVVMNPPFSRGQDVDHVKRAFGLLKPGGRLVSVMSASVKFHGGKKFAAFREMVANYGGAIEDLPEESFREAGTLVNSIVVTLQRPL